MTSGTHPVHRGHRLHSIKDDWLDSMMVGWHSCRHDCCARYLVNNELLWPLFLKTFRCSTTVSRSGNGVACVAASESSSRLASRLLRVLPLRHHVQSPEWVLREALPEARCHHKKNRLGGFQSGATCHSGPIIVERC
jgi:hypothetical protein